ncbi:MAG: type 4a pilus biogenesis protein PilO [Acidobacteriota bacterium]
MPKSINDLPAIAQIGIFVLIAALIGGGVFYYFVFPMFGEKTTLTNQLTTLRAQNEQSRVVEQQLAEYQNRIRQLRRQLATLRSIVPDEQSTENFMRDLTQAGRSTGISIRSMVARPPVERQYHYELTLDVVLAGTYYSLRNFMDALARQQLLVNVRNLALTSILGGTAGSGRGRFTSGPGESVGATCTVVTYFNRPGAGAPPAPGGGQ